MPVADHDAIFEAAAKEWNVHPNLLRAIAQQESGGKPRAVSRAGAVGVMQIMPDTGRELGLVDPTNAEQSIYAGAKYLSQMLDKYRRPELALAAYNAGPGRVDAYIAGKGALPNETQAYVPAVTGHYRRMTQQVADRRDSKVMSDDDFLKAYGAGANPAATSAAPSKSMSDDDFLKTYGAAEAAPTPESTDNRQQGTLDAPVMPQRFQKRAGVPQPVDVGAPLQAGVDAAGRVGAAMAQGAAEGSKPLPPLVTPVMEALGIYPPAAGGGTALQGVNRLLINPIATAGEAALRAVGGAFRGAQAGVAQAGAEVGQPQLGRDLAAMPDAFMGAPGSLGAPRQPANRLTPTSDAANLRIADDLGARIANDVQGPGRGQWLSDRITAAINRADEPAKPTPVGAPVVAEGAPGPRSAGAAATPAGDAAVSRPEMQAQRATAERDRLYEPQPRGVDKNEYIPGVQTTEAQMVQSARISRKEKLLEMEMPGPYKEISKANNEVRGAFYDDMAGTPTLKRRLEEARGEQAEADLRATWKNKQPADTAPVAETAAAILDSPDGRRPAVRGVVKSVMDELTDKNGKPITDPEMLYGVRKHIDDLLSKEAAKDTPMAVRAASQLRALKASLDGVIEGAAPGFREYLKNFSESSRPIDEMTLLQDGRKTITDTAGRISYSGVQRLLKDIVEDRGARGLNEAQSISDDVINKLFALRDDLRRVASSDDLARAKGSDTAQNAMDIVKGLAGKGMAEGAGVIAGAFPGVGSMLLSGLSSNMRANKLKRDVGRSINPDRNKLISPD